MKKSPAIVIPLVLLVLSVTVSNAAGDQEQQESPQQTPPRQPLLEPPAPRPLSFFMMATTAGDSNIDHNEDNVFAYGAAIGGGLQYQNQPEDPSVLITYQTAVHRYAHSNRWDRLSHNLRAVFERELEGPWEVHAIGEISLKGTSEDRELSDQYLITPRIQYRIDRWRRLRAYSTLRLRRYDEDLARNATNRYVGMEFTQRSEGGDEWGLELRLEKNRARDPRNTYIRWTFGTQYLTPIGERNRLEFEVRFRQQNYTDRFVEVDDQDVLRRDNRWVPSVQWVRIVNSHAEMRFGYSLETRASNDLGREFSAHLVTIGAIRRW